MQSRLLSFLADPHDGGALELHSFTTHFEETRDGVLVNPDTQRWYRVQDGIPTLFVDALRPDDTEFVRRFGDQIRALGLAAPESESQKEGDFARIAAERKARDEQAQDYDAMWSLKALAMVEIPAYTKALSVEKETPLLEAGCGTGRFTHVFAQIAPEVVAVDMSRASLVRNRARHRARTYNPVHYVQADLTHLPLKDGVFGRCAHAGVYEHIPSQALRLQFLAHARRTLDPNGTMVLSAYRYAGLTRLWEKEGEHAGGIPFFRFTPEELCEEVETAFHVERFVENLGIYMSMVVARPLPPPAPTTIPGVQAKASVPAADH